MKTRLLVTAFVMASVAAPAFSGTVAGKTHAEVYEELVEAQRNGLRYITDASYPDVSPMYAHLVAKPTAAKTPVTDAMPSVSAPAASAGQTPQQLHGEGVCTGPVSFCTPYFGS